MQPLHYKKPTKLMKTDIHNFADSKKNG